MSTATPTDALERAHQEGILVARLGDDTWRAQSSEPELRGPYLVILDGDGGGHCECAGGAYREACKHRRAAEAASVGAYPISDLSEIQGPAECAAMRRETRAERRQRILAEYDAASLARRASPHARVTQADFDMFG